MDDASPLMHVDWIRLFNAWRQELQKPIEINVEQIVGGGQPLTRVDDTNVTLTLGGTPATALLKAVSLTLGWSGTLAVTRGGTGLSAVTTGDILYGSAANVISRRAIGSTGDVLTVTGGLPVWAATSGLGTGDLARVNDTNVTLTLGGTPVDSLFKDVSLTLGWTGTLGLARGGTNANLSATGGTSQYLKQASAGAAITVGTIPASDIGSGAALTKTDDTNVTLTLGGSPTVALLAATSLTLGWTGTLGVTRGGTGTGTTFTQGSVVFAGASGVYTEANTGIFYNASLVRLGIGTSSPGMILHLKSTASFPTLNIESTTTSGGILQLTSSTNFWQVYVGSGNFKWDVSSAPSGTKMELTNNGLLKLGTTSLINTATNSLFIADGTAPTSGVMPANTGALYVDSFGTSGLFGIDAAGVINRLTDAARGRSPAQTAAVASVTTFTLGASDASFMVSSVVTVTTSTTHNFTVAVDYTDETNTAQTLTLTFSQLAGVLVTAITNVTGAGPYNGVPLQIRCKASTAITIKTVGTFTVVTYNVEGRIQQVTG